MRIHFLNKTTHGGRYLSTGILAVCFLTTTLAAPVTVKPKSPNFFDYPATVYNGPLAEPDVRSHTRSGKYRTTIRYAAKERPDFAGRYKIARWGCGMDCIGFAIIDSATGKVYHPITETVGGLSWCLSDGERDEEILATHGITADEPNRDKLIHRKDSRLLVINDCLQKSRVSFYLWKNNQLVLLKREITQ